MVTTVVPWLDSGMGVPGRTGLRAGTYGTGSVQFRREHMCRTVWPGRHLLRGAAVWRLARVRAPRTIAAAVSGWLRR